MVREESIEVSRQEKIRLTEEFLRGYDEISRGYKSLCVELAKRGYDVPELTSKYSDSQIRDEVERWWRSCGGKAGDPVQPRDDHGRWTSGGTSKPGGASGTGDANDNSQEVFHPADKFSTSEKGVDFIKRSEGFRSQQYLDASKRPTMGYGHLLRRDEGFPNGISEDEALKLLAQDVKKAETTIKGNVKVELSQHKFDALTSLVYNIGGGNFKDSTMLKRLNEGKYDKAADQFPEWNKVTIDGIKVPNAGLTKRRTLERKLFLEGKYE